MYGCGRGPDPGDARAGRTAGVSAVNGGFGRLGRPPLHDTRGAGQDVRHPVESETEESVQLTELAAQPQTRSPSGRPRTGHRHTYGTMVVELGDCHPEDKIVCPAGMALKSGFVAVGRYPL
jgi:hypothetical protein